MIDLLIPKFDVRFPASATMNMWRLAQESKADLMAFVHDDVDIHDDGWVEDVEDFFKITPNCGMVGFGGATGLGTPDLYKRPYKLEQLARIRFMSNMTDAEAHGKRVQVPHKVAVLDGFCQIIRREAYLEAGGWEAVLDLGIQFHCYDTAMACLLAEKKWDVWMLPVSCTHHGGHTSCSPEYDAWLRSLGMDGDAEVHQKAHRIIYNRFRNVLPLRVR